MSRREAWLSAVAVFGVALAIRIWAASFVVFPRPEDAAYYVSVAQSLVQGHGLFSQAIWSYQTPPLTFPRPAFEVWLPLPSFLMAIPMLVLGPTLIAAQAAAVLLGSLTAVLAWRLALDVAEQQAFPRGRALALTLGVGLASAAYLPLVLASVEPDSTAPFTAIVLGAFVLTGRIVRAPSNRRLVALGLLIGLAGLTRNEAVWLGLAWAVVALGIALREVPGHGRRRLTWARLVAVPGVVALAVYAPWAIRDWLTFGTPLPGQALANALSLQGTDIFAWSNPPTLSRYLGAGLGTLLDLRVTGFVHNLVEVLLLLGIPVSAVGLLALPWTVRAPTIRPLLLFSILVFAETTLIFPVATTWGTFLHAAGPAEVLLLLSAGLGLDRLIDRVRAARGWTRPVAWLGPAFTISAAAVLTLALLPSEGATAKASEARYSALPVALADAGVSLDSLPGPIITDTPIWFATTTGHAAIAFPHEDSTSVLDLADYFGSTLLVLDSQTAAAWAGPQGPPATCFTPLVLTHLGDDPDPLAGVTVYRIRCP
ncbi:MAG TPA: hypothetical protein VKR30_05270 [Candidatus Limnocylindrales bacterium]|nr:hypothetical protein [Candidatus Limnocylindrales bacterium]